MSTEKFSPQLLKSILEAEGIDTSGLHDNLVGGSTQRPSIRKLSLLERKRALKTLAMLIAQFRSGSDDLLSFPLEDLHDVLRLLAELAGEAKQSDKNREEKRKALHAAAAMLRRMLHMRDASHYRVLGLNDGANPARISEHYRLLHELFWFDEAIDPQRKSRLRISEAYTVLKDHESRKRYDEDLARLEQQQLRSLTGGRGRRVWWGVVALTLLATGTVLFLYISALNGVRDNREADGIATETTGDQPVKLSDAEQAPSMDEVPEPAPEAKKEELPHPEVASGSESASGDTEEKVVEPVVTRAEPVAEKVERKSKKESVKRESSAKEGSPLVATAVDMERKPSSSQDKKRNQQTSERGKIHRYHISRADASVALKEAKEPVKEKRSFDEGATSLSVPYPEESLLVPPRIVVPQEDLFEEKGSGTSGVSASLDSSARGLEQAAESEPVMVVIGSPALRVDRLGKNQVRDIFLAQEPRLPDGERVVVIAPQGSSSAKVKFYRDVLGKSPRQLKIHWAKIRFQGRFQPLEQVVDDEMVKEKVAGSVNAIGIIKSTAVDGSVKVLFKPGGNRD